jgi:iron complex transport system substrate-binding protein
MHGRALRAAVVTIAVFLTAGTLVGASAVPIGAGSAPVPDSKTPTSGAAAPIAAQQGSQGCSFPTTVTDATGTEVTLQEQPDRIVVLAPSDAQTLWAIGAREAVVGMPIGQYTAYLNGTQGKIDVVADDGSVNTEQVVGLQPDVVFAASVTPNETVAQLRQAGLTVYSTDLATSIEDVYGVTERYGRLTGNCEDANETVSEMRTRVNEIENAVDESDQPPALYYFYNFTAGQGTHINDVMETAGARNIAAQAGITDYEQISAEIVASRNPEWIVHPADSPVPQGQPYSSTAALEENQTVALRTNLIQQPAPRIVYPLTRLARALHPEAMNEANLSAIDFSSQAGATNASGTDAGANATAGTDGTNGTGTGTKAPVAADGGNATVSPTSTADVDAGGTGTTASTAGEGAATEGTGSGTEAGTTGTATTTETTGPGFGLLGAVIALLAVALLARYRD